MMSRSQPATLRAPKDSIAWRVVDFLQANPSEELGRSDVAAKFDIDASEVDYELRPAVDSGHIVREQNDNGLVWRLNYSKRGNPKPFAPSLVAARKAARAARKPVVIDFAGLVIEKGIPLVDNSRAGTSAWEKLLDRMEAGDSVLLALEARDAAAHAYAAYRRKHPDTKFSVRKVGNEQCRIWRLA